MWFQKISQKTCLCEEKGDIKTIKGGKDKKN